MNTWSLEKHGFDPADAAGDGNRFLCANGYLGLRGVPEEAGRELFPAITLAGVYDQFEDRWREPVNAPLCLSIRAFFDGEPLENYREHKQWLDYRHGVYRRETDFGPVTVRSQRFASLAACHLLADRYQVECAREGEVTLQIGISTDIWDINGPHLFGFRMQADDALTVEAVTGEKRIAVAAGQCLRADFDAEESLLQNGSGVFRLLKKRVKKGETCAVSAFAAVYTIPPGPPRLSATRPKGRALTPAFRPTGTPGRASGSARRSCWRGMRTRPWPSTPASTT